MDSIAAICRLGQAYHSDEVIKQLLKVYNYAKLGANVTLDDVLIFTSEIYHEFWIFESNDTKDQMR